MSDHAHDENDINDLGLQADLSMWQKKPLERRRILQLGLAGITTLLANRVSAAGSDGVSACVSEIPEETAGRTRRTGPRSAGATVHRRVRLLGGCPVGHPPAHRLRAGNRP